MSLKAASQYEVERKAASEYEVEGEVCHKAVSQYEVEGEVSLKAVSQYEVEGEVSLKAASPYEVEVEEAKGVRMNCVYRSFSLLRTHIVAMSKPSLFICDWLECFIKFKFFLHMSVDMNLVALIEVMRNYDDN